MKNMKTGVVLLALLLAGMAMVPIVSAANASATPDVLSDSLDNKTTTYHGDTLQAVKWVNHQIDASKVNKPLTREEFLRAEQGVY